MSFSVPINGILVGWSSRGLRHGDTHLFVIGMGVFSSLINQTVSRVTCLGIGYVKGRGGDEIQNSQLLFADDTSVSWEDFQDQMAHLSWVLCGLKPHWN